MKKGPIKKRPAVGFFSESQTRKETVTFLDTNNHSLREKGKKHTYSSRRGNKKMKELGNVYLPYNAENTKYIGFFRFRSVNYFRVYSIRKYHCVLIVDPVTVHLSNAQSFSIFCFAAP